MLANLAEATEKQITETEPLSKAIIKMCNEKSQNIFFLRFNIILVRCVISIKILINVGYVLIYFFIKI